MWFLTQLKSTNLNSRISNISNKQLHQIPFFLIGAMTCTISTVYIYFDHRQKLPIHKSSKNLIGPPHI